MPHGPCTLHLSVSPADTRRTFSPSTRSARRMAEWPAALHISVPVAGSTANPNGWSYMRC
eukprot:1707126-Prymnesium_polylepis.1